VADKVSQRVKESEIAQAKVACLGLAFKPDIDDLRGSPAIEVVKELIASNLNVVCVEPNIETHAEFSISSFDDALRGADVIVVLVGHKEFRSKVNRELLSSVNAMDFCGVII